MIRRVENTTLLLTDFVTLNATFLLYYLARFRWNWLPAGPEPPSIFGTMLIITLLWMVLFAMSGLYRSDFAPSRFDELVLLGKVVIFGSLMLFFLVFGNVLTAGAARRNLLYYWGFAFSMTAFGRVIYRSIQKALLKRGYGVHKALIIGWNERVHELYEEVAKYPVAGLKIVGAIRLKEEQIKEEVPEEELVEVEAEVDKPFVFSPGKRREDMPLSFSDSSTGEESEYLRSVYALPRVIKQLGVEDVLVVLGARSSDVLAEVIRVCDGQKVNLKLVPDFYHILSGMAHTEQIYGLPLLEVNAAPMKPWQIVGKRIMDIVVSSIILLLGAPIWFTVGMLVRLSSPGPAIFKQERVGKEGKLFTMLKFRTMIKDAEKDTGPVWASESDSRYTKMGKWMRKTRIDEIPQLWNVVKGEMSLVGPRPERQFFVAKLTSQIPMYHRRLRVKPGITGLAQVKWKYDETIDDVRQKVKYDLSYTSNMSLGMDLKILFATLRTALKREGQ